MPSAPAHPPHPTFFSIEEHRLAEGWALFAGWKLSMDMVDEMTGESLRLEPAGRRPTAGAEIGAGFVLVRFALGVSTVRSRDAVEIARHDTLRDALRALMPLSRTEEMGVKAYEPVWLWVGYWWLGDPARYQRAAKRARRRMT